MAEEIGGIKIMIERKKRVSTLKANKKSQSNQIQIDTKEKRDMKEKMTDLKEKIGEILKKEGMIMKSLKKRKNQKDSLLKNIRHKKSQKQEH